MTRTTLLLAATVWMFAMALFCGAQESPKAAPSAAFPESSNDTQHPVAQQRDLRYQLRPGDTFSLTFPFTPEFNQGSVAVQPDGFATLTGLGEISVVGKTLPELRELVQKSYSTIVSQQVIGVELKDFEKPYFVVGGEVGHPGKFDLRSDTTVAEAVMIAGGLKESSKHSQVLLFRRVSDEWMGVKKLDLKKMLSSGNLSEDLHLRAGDMVYVPKNALSKIKPFIPVSGVGMYANPL